MARFSGVVGRVMLSRSHGPAHVPSPLFEPKVSGTAGQIPSQAIAAALTVAGLGSTLLLGVPEAHAVVSCNNGRETHTTCHPIGPATPGVCEPNPGGSPAQLAFYWMCDEYGFRSKLALDMIAVDDPATAVELGYTVCAKMPPPDYDSPWAGTPAQKAAKATVLASGVVPPDNVEQFMIDAIMWLC